MRDLNALSLPDLYRRFEHTGLVRRLMELARDEDLGPRRLDITSTVSVPAEARAEATIVARAAGTIAGVAVMNELIDVYGMRIECVPSTKDGDRVPAGTVLAHLRGSKRDLLAVERPALNLVGRLSGIATTAAAFVAAMTKGGPVRSKVYDTRKTMPGLRVLEKYAARCGEAMCHRIGLYDAVLIKDNHLSGVGLDSLSLVVADAAAKARMLNPELGFFEVEVESLDQFSRVLALGPGLVDIVLLDNMNVEQLKAAVAMRDKSRNRVELEASGGVRLDTIRAIAETGVERISAGAITHSAQWLDVAMDMRT